MRLRRSRRRRSTAGLQAGPFNRPDCAPHNGVTRVAKPHPYKVLAAMAGPATRPHTDQAAAVAALVKQWWRQAACWDPEAIANRSPEQGPAAVGIHRQAALWAIEAQRADRDRTVIPSTQLRTAKPGHASVRVPAATPALSSTRSEAAAYRRGVGFPQGRLCPCVGAAVSGLQIALQPGAPTRRGRGAVHDLRCCPAAKHARQRRHLTLQNGRQLLPAGLVQA